MNVHKQTLTFVAVLVAGTCGYVETAGAIAGGVESDFGPAVVIIIQDPPNTGESKFCGGVLIDEEWLLTAAHCFDDNDPRQRSVLVNVAVELDNGTDLQCISGSGFGPVGQNPCSSWANAKAFIHPDYSDGRPTIDDEDDMALVRLEPAASWQLVTSPSPDPADPYARIGTNAPREGDWISIDGYSYIDKDKDDCESTPGRPPEACPRWDRTRGIFYVDDVDDRDVEFDNSEGYQTCAGDSGSPLRLSDEVGPVIVGVYSQGWPRVRGKCNWPGSGAQASRINREKFEWIESTTGLDCYRRVEERAYRCFGNPPAAVAVPDVTGQTCGDARSLLRAAGFFSTCTPDYGPPGTAVGEVFEQVPTAGQMLNPGNTVQTLVHKDSDDGGGGEEPLSLDEGET